MKRKKNMPLKYIILIIILILLILLLIFNYTLKDDRKLSKVESVFKDTVTCIIKVLRTPIDYIGDIISDFKELKDVQKENQLLKDSLEKVDYVNTENIELKRQIEKLKEELDIEYSLTDYEYLNSTIISRNIGYWYNTITIDKGSYNGVKKDMPVVNKQGLIGRVVSTTNFTSVVKLITTTDTSNKLSVLVTDGNYDLYGLLYQYDEVDNLLLVEGISNTDKVNINDLVYTSGMGGIFPSGIMIGKVTSISTDSYGLSKIIKVSPSVDFSSLNYVTILKRKDELK